MKYIKLFENKYYSKITEDELDSYNLSVNGGGSFTELEIMEINNLKFKDVTITTKGTKWEDMIDVIINSNTDRSYVITIFRGIDEWYFIRTRGVHSSLYYKCDQFDGLLMCLRDIISKVR